MKKWWGNAVTHMQHLDYLNIEDVTSILFHYFNVILTIFQLFAQKVRFSVSFIPSIEAHVEMTL